MQNLVRYIPKRTRTYRELKIHHWSNLVCKSRHYLLYRLPKINLVYLCCVNFLVCTMEHRSIVIQLCYVSASHVYCLSWFQSSCGAVGTTAAQNAECCWAKQSCAEPSGERRHQRKARYGGSQMSTFNEDTKVCTALPVVVSSQVKALQLS